MNLKIKVHRTHSNDQHNTVEQLLWHIEVQLSTLGTTKHAELLALVAGQIAVVKAPTVTFCPLLNQNCYSVRSLFS
jgi:hypothetical protein